MDINTCRKSTKFIFLYFLSFLYFRCLSSRYKREMDETALLDLADPKTLESNEAVKIMIIEKAVRISSASIVKRRMNEPSSNFISGHSLRWILFRPFFSYMLLSFLYRASYPWVDSVVIVIINFKPTKERRDQDALRRRENFYRFLVKSWNIVCSEGNIELYSVIQRDHRVMSRTPVLLADIRFGNWEVKPLEAEIRVPSIFRILSRYNIYLNCSFQYRIFLSVWALRRYIDESFSPG